MTDVADLPSFLRAMADLLETIERGKEVLFRESFRNELSPVISDTNSRLRELASDENVINPSASNSMHAAGLSGSHLALKLKSFQSALQSFRDTAREDQLEEALGKGSTILGSLAGAIPGFGSFAQELVDFLLKELKRRLFRRKLLDG